MRVERIVGPDSPVTVLRALASATARLGLPPPAALTGDWFGSRAVIAPSVAVAPVAAADVFDVDVGAAPDAAAVGGGWIGYLSYPDAGADGRGPRIPEAAGGWTDGVLRQDVRRNLVVRKPFRCSRYPVGSPRRSATPVTPGHWHVDWTEPDRDAHQRACWPASRRSPRARCTRRACAPSSSARSTVRPVDFFADAVARTAPARAAFVAGDWGAVASLSPELFLRRSGDTITSSPIKGTLPLDRAAAALRSSVKDVAENVMIVDLVRNDLGRVAVTGSVTVPELLAVRPAPGVWHLVSTVSARVDVDVPMATVLDATFPPASVTGTPKARARELLVGTGSRVGAESTAAQSVWRHPSPEPNSTSRSAPSSSTPTGRAVLGVGGGITADSDPDAEWQECLHKAAAIVAITNGPGTARRVSPRVVPAR